MYLVSYEGFYIPNDIGSSDRCTNHLLVCISQVQIILKKNVQKILHVVLWCVWYVHLHLTYLYRQDRWIPLTSFLNYEIFNCTVCYIIETARMRTKYCNSNIHKTEWFYFLYDCSWYINNITDKNLHESL